MVLILVTGARDWQDSNSIRSVLSSYIKKKESDGCVTLVHGGCTGADIMCGDIAKQLGFTSICMAADWGKYGRAAGPIRNKQMVDYVLDQNKTHGEPVYMYAFHNNLAKSKGTANCVNYARSKGIIPTIIRSGTI